VGLVREAVRTCMHDAQSEHFPLLEEGCVVCRRACTAGTRIERLRETTRRIAVVFVSVRPATAWRLETRESPERP
jgi:hypothetical protein